MCSGTYRNIVQLATAMLHNTSRAKLTMNIGSMNHQYDATCHHLALTPTTCIVVQVLPEGATVTQRP